MTDPITLTLQQIRDVGPCSGGWTKLCKAVGTDMTTVIGLGDVLISNNLDDALWCLRCLSPRDRVDIVMPFSKRASVHTTDERVHHCIAKIERWLAGDDSVDLLAAAEAAARAAARAAEAEAAAAAEAAWAAARAAERDLQRADIMRLSPPMVLKMEAVR